MDSARYFRQTRDAALSKSVALPAAGATVYTDSLDLGSIEPGSATEDFDVLVEVPLTPNLANGKNLTAVIQDSADNQNFTPVASTGGPLVTGPANGGGGVASQRLKLPSTVRQFIRAAVTADAGSGDVTAQAATMSLVF